MRIEDCKPGVRVAVYDFGNRYIGKITADHPGEKLVVTTRKRELLYVHPKQLRKLKSKEKKQEPPREQWLNLSPVMVTRGYDSEEEADDRNISSDRLNNRAYKYVLAEDQE